MDSQQERELADELRTGNADAWRSLYDAYAEPVWRVVARLMGGRSADVADVVQETFIAAARSARSFDAERGTLWFWLCGIARRHVALHYRKLDQQQRVREAKTKLSVSNGALSGWLDGGSPSPPELASSAEMAVLVRTVLTELTDDYGTLLAARYLDGVPVEQIASSEKATETAIRSKLARARRAFRDVFVKMSGE